MFFVLKPDPQNAGGQALIEQLDRDLSDATQQRCVKLKYQVGAYAQRRRA